MKQLFAIAVCICCTVQIKAQSFAINTDGSTANSSSILDVKSTDKGVLIPRMSKAQKNTIASPATGLLIFQNAPDSVGFYYYNGSGWLWLATASNVTGWSTTGNAGTDTAVNFIGTTTSMPVRFKQNNQWIGQFDNNQGNFFIGGNAGKNNAGGIANVAFGGGALSSNSSGSFNHAIGGSALFANTTGSQNIAIGNTALGSHKTGDNNVTIGATAMWQDTFATNNVAVGAFSLFAAKNVSGNVAIGQSALFNNKKGGFKTAIGNQALLADTSLSPNVAIGSSALLSNVGGKSLVAIGANALASNTVGNNVAVGTAALELNAVSSNNTAVGDSSLRNNTGSDNTAIGSGTLYSNSFGVFETAIGSNALRNNTTGFGNTAIGYTALYSNTTGSSNIGIGTSALYLHKTGGGNIAIGSNAMFNDTTGTSNVAIGTNAMSNSRSVDLSVAVGNSSLQNNKNGLSIVAIGASALLNDTTGNYNVAIGSSSLQSNRNGQHNIGIGYSAGFANTTGTENIFIGSNSDAASNNLTNSTAIGYKSYAAQDNSIVLGSISGVNTATSSVHVGIGTNIPNARMHIVRNGASGGTYLNSGLIVEDNTSSFIQLSHPNTAQTGIFSGNASTTSRSGMTFNADSSLDILAGGNSNRIHVGNTGNIGINTTTPDARFHIVRNGSSGGTYQPESGLILENSSIFTLQFSTPNGSPALIRSGNASTPQRSGITFEADSSINFNSGGSLNRMIIDNTGYVGVRTSAPVSYLDVAGSVGNAISTSTVSTTLDDQDHTHIILPTASAVVITLPAAGSCARREYTIVNQDNSVQAISSYLDFTGGASITLLANSSITIQSNGTSWYRIR